MIDPSEAHRALTHTAGAWVANGLGQFEVVGPDAHAFVNRVATADLSLLDPGRFVHSLLLNDDATILGRLTVYRFADRVMLLVDAAQREAAWEHIVARKRGNVRLRDISDDVGVIAVRGPAVTARISPVLAPYPDEPGTVITARLAGIDVFAARATADGPDGIDLYCRGRDRDSLEWALGRAGALPVDEAAWRLLRLEWGIANVGAEIDAGDTPVEAALEHLVAEGKGAPFPGEIALVARRRAGALKRLVGFHVSGDDVPPIAARVDVGGVVVDRVRSVGRSPSAGIIGMTAVPTTADVPGTRLTFAAGGKTWRAAIVRRPFVTRSGAAVESLPRAVLERTS
ncbi:MAG TPA: glycine cleavage T C-terminal barrel domain-containing protein [Gemmatimonadales bacterium]|jgi:glycine cleavage system aminomethyltransferase T|nr:glycine cleavage T C-terminal barrel domain-containing protein [Gemmatimonadales bacterium]